MLTTEQWRLADAAADDGKSETEQAKAAGVKLETLLRAKMDRMRRRPPKRKAPPRRP